MASGKLSADGSQDGYEQVDREKFHGDAIERRYDDKAERVTIPVRAERADMPTGETKSRCAWGAVNAPAVRWLHAMRLVSLRRLKQESGGVNRVGPF